MRARVSLSVATAPVCPLARTRALPWSGDETRDRYSGPAPTELVIEDLVPGDGAQAAPGDTVEVHHVGVEYDTGDEFDSSWNRGQSIEFPLRGLIQGWQDGIPGMKVGGWRQLVIPPERPTARPAPGTGCPARP